MTTEVRLDRKVVSVRVVLDPLMTRQHTADLQSQCLDNLMGEIQKVAPNCRQCRDVGINVMKDFEPARFAEAITMQAYCRHGVCNVKEQEVAGISDIFEPGWSTSKPGDMKNGGGLPTKFGRERPWPAGSKNNPCAEIPLPALSGGMTAADFNREYGAAFNEAHGVARDAAMVPPPPHIDRDKPESASADAW